jgi:hypothetical protein
MPIIHTDEEYDNYPWDKENDGHFHKDDRGVLHKCYHKCRGALTSWQFWFGSVVSQVIWFPAEHLLWEKVWPFYELTHWLGL